MTRLTTSAHARKFLHLSIFPLIFSLFYARGVSFQDHQLLHWENRMERQKRRQGNATIVEFNICNGCIIILWILYRIMIGSMKLLVYYVPGTCCCNRSIQKGRYFCIAILSCAIWILWICPPFGVRIRQLLTYSTVVTYLVWQLVN